MVSTISSGQRQRERASAAGERDPERIPRVAAFEVADHDVAEHPLGVRAGALEVEAQGRQAAQDDPDPRLLSLDLAQRREQRRERVALAAAIVGEEVGLVVEQQRTGSIRAAERTVKLRPGRAASGRPASPEAVVVGGLVTELADREAPGPQVANPFFDRLADRGQRREASAERIAVLLDGVGQAAVVAMALPDLALQGDPAGAFGPRCELGQEDGLAGAAQAGEGPIRVERTARRGSASNAASTGSRPARKGGATPLPGRNGLASCSVRGFGRSWSWDPRLRCVVSGRGAPLAPPRPPLCTCCNHTPLLRALRDAEPARGCAPRAGPRRGRPRCRGRCRCSVSCPEAVEHRAGDHQVGHEELGPFGREDRTAGARRDLRRRPLADLRVDLDEVAIDATAVAAADELDVAVRLVVAAADERHVGEGRRCAGRRAPASGGCRPRGGRGPPRGRSSPTLSRITYSAIAWTASPRLGTTRAKASALFVPRASSGKACRDRFPAS